jgi:hypothetical protein
MEGRRRARVRPLPVNFLIACECSGVVREAFRARGHNAWSCDLKPADDGSAWHLQGDALHVASGFVPSDGNQRMCWDLMIAHPDCTYLTNSAEWAYKDGPYHMKLKVGTLTGAARRSARAQAFEFFMALWNCNIPHICIENPIGVVSRLFRPADQIVQPWQYGDDASKGTGLWLKNLPKLVSDPAKHVAPRIVLACGPPGTHFKRLKRWANQTDSGQNRLSPSDDRAAKRAVTYKGIANAMAEQWGIL